MASTIPSGPDLKQARVGTGASWPNWTGAKGIQNGVSKEGVTGCTKGDNVHGMVLMNKVWATIYIPKKLDWENSFAGIPMGTWPVVSSRLGAGSSTFLAYSLIHPCCALMLFTQVGPGAPMFALFRNPRRALTCRSCTHSVACTSEQVTEVCARTAWVSEKRKHGRTRADLDE